MYLNLVFLHHEIGNGLQSKTYTQNILLYKIVRKYTENSQTNTLQKSQKTNKNSRRKRGSTKKIQIRYFLLKYSETYRDGITAILNSDHHYENLQDNRSGLPLSLGVQISDSSLQMLVPVSSNTCILFYVKLFLPIVKISDYHHNDLRYVTSFEKRISLWQVF